MAAPINGSISALQAFSKQMLVSANNVANVNSVGFKKSRAVISQGQNGDVKTDTVQIDTRGPLIEDPAGTDGELIELSNTDVAEEFMVQIMAQHGYEANAKSIKTYDEMLGTILDIVG